MFSSEHVDSLFANTRFGLARSCQLLEERRYPSAALSAGAAGSRAGLLWPSLHANIATTPFAPTLRTLEGLSHLGALTDVSNDMVTRLASEATQPSSAMARQRAKGRAFPLLQRMVKAATTAASQGASMEGDALQLWRDSTHASADMENAHDTDAWLRSSTDSVSGAAISSALVLCAFCVDACHLLASLSSSSSSSQQRVMEEPVDGELVPLLHEFARAVPPHLVTHTVHAMLSLLKEATPNDYGKAAAASPLPLALVYFPSLVAYTLLEGAPFVAAEAVLKPLETEADALLSANLHNETYFSVRANACAVFIGTVSKALLLTLAASGAATTATLTSGAISAESTARRVLSSLKQLVTTFVTPIESAFTASVARPGMTAALYESLVSPLSIHVDDALASANAALHARVSVDRDRRVATLETARALLHTGVYRLLMVLESLGGNELYLASGKANAVAQQKQYEERLRQSNGKLTTSLFTSLVEDRQLVLEETNARSEGGHRVLKITDGVHKDPSVFVYIDDGSVFVKRGRVGKFRTVTSVEEVFKVFEAS